MNDAVNDTDDQLTLEISRAVGEALVTARATVDRLTRENEALYVENATLKRALLVAKNDVNRMPARRVGEFS